MFYKRESWALTETQRKDHHVKTGRGGVGTGVMLSEAKRGEETPSPGGNVALLHYDLGLSAFRTVRQCVSSAESTPQFVITSLVALGNNTHI